MGIGESGLFFPSAQLPGNGNVPKPKRTNLSAVAFDHLKAPRGEGLGGPERPYPVDEDKKGLLDGVEDLGGRAESAGKPPNPGTPEPQDGLEGLGVAGHSSVHKIDFLGVGVHGLLTVSTR